MTDEELAAFERMAAKAAVKVEDQVGDFRPADEYLPIVEAELKEDGRKPAGGTVDDEPDWKR